MATRRTKKLTKTEGEMVKFLSGTLDALQIEPMQKLRAELKDELTGLMATRENLVARISHAEEGQRGDLRVQLAALDQQRWNCRDVLDAVEKLTVARSLASTLCDRLMAPPPSPSKPVYKELEAPAAKQVVRIA